MKLTKEKNFKKDTKLCLEQVSRKMYLWRKILSGKKHGKYERS